MKLMTLARNFWHDEDGGEAVEWPLVVALVIIGIVGFWDQVRDAIDTVLTGIATALTGAATPSSGGGAG